MRIVAAAFSLSFATLVAIVQYKAFHPPLALYVFTGPGPNGPCTPCEELKADILEDRHVAEVAAAHGLQARGLARGQHARDRLGV